MLKTTVSAILMDGYHVSVICVACMRDFTEAALKKVEEDGKKDDLNELDASRMISSL